MARYPCHLTYFIVIMRSTIFHPLANEHGKKMNESSPALQFGLRFYWVLEYYWELYSITKLSILQSTVLVVTATWFSNYSRWLSYKSYFCFVFCNLILNTFKFYVLTFTRNIIESCTRTRSYSFDESTILVVTVTWFFDCFEVRLWFNTYYCFLWFTIL